MAVCVRLSVVAFQQCWDPGFCCWGTGFDWTDLPIATDGLGSERGPWVPEVCSEWFGTDCRRLTGCGWQQQQQEMHKILHYIQLDGQQPTTAAALVALVVARKSQIPLGR